MSLEDDELEGLKSMNNYVAGFTDPGIEAHDDLYDVFVNGKDNGGFSGLIMV